MLVAIKPQRRHDDQVDLEALEVDGGSGGNAFEPLAHDMRGILGREQQHAATLRSGKAAQAGGAGGDGDSEIERQERLSALGLAADDTDRLRAPEAFDQPRRLAALGLSELSGAYGWQRLHRGALERGVVGCAGSLVAGLGRVQLAIGIAELLTVVAPDRLTQIADELGDGERLFRRPRVREDEAEASGNGHDLALRR